MKRSTERILVSHAGALPLPDSLQEEMSQAAFEERLPSAVADIVRRQAGYAVDVVNDGELSKRGGFSGYAKDRLGGIERRTFEPGKGPAARDVNGRDRQAFPGFFTTGRFASAGGMVHATAAQPLFCNAPLTYVGRQGVDADIANFKAALSGLDVEGYLPAIAPGTIEHWMWNEYYPSDEAFLFAIADAMHEEYKAITDAGLILQIDDPDLPDGWQMFPGMSVEDYRKYAELRVEALNHALRDLPESQIRLHVCWGSGHGPHQSDIPLRDIIDLILKVRAECVSLEGAESASRA